MRHGLNGLRQGDEQPGLSLRGRGTFTETERVYSFNPAARTGPFTFCFARIAVERRVLRCADVGWR